MFKPTLLASASDAREMTRALRQLPGIREVEMSERDALAGLAQRGWDAAASEYLALSKRARDMGFLRDAKRFARAYGACQTRAARYERAQEQRAF